MAQEEVCNLEAVNQLMGKLYPVIKSSYNKNCVTIDPLCKDARIQDSLQIPVNVKYKHLKAAQFKIIH